ncbi:hypothetical protein BgiMline_028289 [Biomphalaria glabrata]
MKLLWLFILIITKCTLAEHRTRSTFVNTKLKKETTVIINHHTLEQCNFKNNLTYTSITLKKITHHKWKFSIRHSRNKYLSLLILIAGDVESNSGPRSKDRCNICKKICTLKQKAIQCDTCDEWYHASCLHMNTPVYYALGNKDASWHCVPCGLPQFTSGLFDSFDADTSNPYNILNTIPNQTHQPLARSTPVKPKSTKINTTASLNKPTKEVIPKYLKTLVINFQSIRNKTADLEILLECEKPDIIAGTETWLHPEIYNAEIFNSNYEIFRKDRADNHGGVLLAIKNTLIAEEITLPNSKNVESTFCKINTTSTSLIIGSIYRPPNSSLEYMQELCNQITTLKETNKNAVFWIMELVLQR